MSKANSEALKKIMSSGDKSMSRANRHIIKHAKKMGKSVCKNCGNGINPTEYGEDTCKNCA